ncbi:MAG TPA: signal recognition particle receptor subunit alpha, partial [Pyrinomonadaceae bacterium]|nr:signal recognition particle receptor subunit alpha [Pyrinomonadaceae bacterium]
MRLFWKRKSSDQFVSLKLNEPLPEKATGDAPEKGAPREVERASPARTSSPSAPASSDLATRLDPVATGGGPTPVPAEVITPKAPTPEAPAPSPAREEASRVARSAPAASVATRSPFQTSVLGLNLSMEELQAQEAALEQEFSARFRRAVSATRESLSERLDTVFQGLKQIDENLLDELEEALIAADIGVATTQHILETVRRGVARKQINDLDALKKAIKDELLKILRQSENQGVASETSVAANVSPYVMMIVGVNGVGKTTTIGKLAQRIKAEGNDVLIC